MREPAVVLGEARDDDLHAPRRKGLRTPQLGISALRFTSYGPRVHPTQTTFLLGYKRPPSFRDKIDPRHSGTLESTTALPTFAAEGRSVGSSKVMSDVHPCSYQGGLSEKSATFILSCSCPQGPHNWRLRVLPGPGAME